MWVRARHRLQTRLRYQQRKLRCWWASAGELATRYGGFFISLELVLLAVALVSVFSVKEQFGWEFWTLLLVGLLVVSIQLYQLYAFLVQRHDLYSARQLAEQRLHELTQAQGELQRIHDDNLEAEQQAQESSDRYTQLSQALQGDSVEALSRNFFELIAREWQLVQGVLFLGKPSEGIFTQRAGYAYYRVDAAQAQFSLGETLTGQVVANGEPLFLEELPSDYRVIVSGLGQAVPNSLYIFPVGDLGQQCCGAVELAFFCKYDAQEQGLMLRFVQEYAHRLLGMPCSGTSEEGGKHGS